MSSGVVEQRVGSSWAVCRGAGRGYGYVAISRFRSRAGCYLFGRIRCTDFLPVGEPRDTEVLERGYLSVNSSDSEADVRALEERYREERRGRGRGGEESGRGGVWAQCREQQAGERGKRLGTLARTRSRKRRSRFAARSH